VPGDKLKGAVEDNMVSVREKTVGALLDKLKLDVDNEVGDAAADIEGIAVEVAPRSAAAIASAVAS